MFQFLSPQGYICLADVIREYDKVGVAHADEGAFEAAAIDAQFAIGHLAVAHSQLLRILQYWFQHVNGHAFHLIIYVYVQVEHLDAR